MKQFRKIVLGLAAALTMAAPLTANAANVRIEGAINVQNVTSKETQFQKSTNAQFDDVVRIQVWYHNMENPDSGLVANNLKVKVNLPTVPSQAQTVSTTISADNTNTVTDSATVNLANAQGTLQFIPGSAQWYHNVGTNAAPNFVSTNISDSIVTSSAGLVLENEQPCFNFAASITLLARVIQPSVSITKQVRIYDESKPHNQQAQFAGEITANPGQEVEYVLNIKNDGNTTLTGVVAADNLPSHMTYVPGSTLLVNSLTNSKPKTLADGITTGGITIDDMAPGSSQFVYLRAKIDQTLPCGANRLSNVGIVRSGKMEIFNTAYVNVNMICQTPTPTPTPTPTLPQTGGGEDAVLGVLGTGSLGYAVQAYRRSKRSLVDALKKGFAQR